MRESRAGKLANYLINELNFTLGKIYGGQLKNSVLSAGPIIMRSKEDTIITGHFGFDVTSQNMTIG